VRIKVLCKTTKEKHQTTILHKLLPFKFKGKEVNGVMQGGEMAKM
jgi:hypothetical protein